MYAYTVINASKTERIFFFMDFSVDDNLNSKSNIGHGKNIKITSHREYAEYSQIDEMPTAGTEISND
jgi:hypothetical protein